MLRTFIKLLPLRSLFCLFLSGRFTQVLLYNTCIHVSGKESTETKKQRATGPPPMDPSKLYVNPQEEDQMVISMTCHALLSILAT